MNAARPTSPSALAELRQVVARLEATATRTALPFGISDIDRRLPAGGLELVDPKVQAELKRKREAENAGYFSGGTFTQINAGKTDAGGFKVPGLPPAKKANTNK